MGSTTSSCTLERLLVDADFRSCLPGGKYPERWFGAGEVGDDSTEEASVSVVSRDPTVEARDRPVDTLWSESSAEEWVEAVEVEIFLMFEPGRSGAL